MEGQASLRSVFFTIFSISDERVAFLRKMDSYLVFSAS